MAKSSKSKKNAESRELLEALTILEKVKKYQQGYITGMQLRTHC